MGFFGKLFGSKPKMGKMEAYISGLSPSSFKSRLHTVRESDKVPGAQVLMVLGYCGAFAKELRKVIKSMPRSIQTDQPFPYEEIIREAAGFYYYCMIKDYLSYANKVKDADTDDFWESIDDKQNGEGETPADPYFYILEKSMFLCGDMLNRLSDERIPAQYIGNRAHAYVQIQNRRDSNVKASFQQFVMELWNPVRSGSPVTDLFAPMIPIQAVISGMPVQAVREACRELYDLKIRNPTAY